MTVMRAILDLSEATRREVGLEALLAQANAGASARSPNHGLSNFFSNLQTFIRCAI